MTLHFTEGFDRYGAVADLSLRYARNSGAYSATAGVAGGGAFTTNSSLSYLDFTFLSAVPRGAGTAIHAAFWLKINAFPAGTNPSDLLAIGTNQVGTGSTTSRLFGLLGDGTIWAKTHGGTQTQTNSSAGVLVLGQWHHIEIAARYTDSGGFIKVWVDRNRSLTLRAIPTPGRPHPRASPASGCSGPMVPATRPSMTSSFGTRRGATSPIPSCRAST